MTPAVRTPTGTHPPAEIARDAVARAPDPVGRGGGLVGALAVCAAVALGACAPQSGDFGRAPAGVYEDHRLAFGVGYLAETRGEPVSDFPWTDNERDLRKLAYALIMPAHPLDRWNQFWAELRRTRIGDPLRSAPDPKGYCNTLLAEPHRSSTARFVRIVDDIRADRSRIPPFFAKAAEVAEADRIRLAAIGYVSSLTPAQIRNAVDRVEENRMVADWVRAGLKSRVASYRCAIHLLVVATPEADAVMAERELAALEADMAGLDRFSAPVRGPQAAAHGPTARGFFPDVSRPSAIVNPPEDAVLIK